MPTLNETFAVSNPQNAWGVISDLNKLVPLVPGARVVSSDSPQSVKAEITVSMGAMSMKFVGPVTIESADAGSQTVKIKAKTTEAGGQSAANGDVTIGVGGGTGRVNAVATVSGKAGSMGEGTVVAVLTALIKQCAANLSSRSARRPGCARLRHPGHACRARRSQRRPRLSRRPPGYPGVVSMARLVCGKERSYEGCHRGRRPLGRRWGEGRHRHDHRHAPLGAAPARREDGRQRSR
jgi:carbon monoxide dehydrogenase subunit G